jgi:hypothetical protein
VNYIPGDSSCPVANEAFAFALDLVDCVAGWIGWNISLRELYSIGYREVLNRRQDLPSLVEDYCQPVDCLVANEAFAFGLDLV